MKVEMFEDVENKYDLEHYTLYVDSSHENTILLMMGGETVKELMRNFSDAANEYAFCLFNPDYKQGMKKFDSTDLEPLFEQCKNVGNGRIGKNSKKYTKETYYVIHKEKDGWSIIFCFRKSYFFSKMRESKIRKAYESLNENIQNVQCC